ncbi:MAG TPA: universal stress protein, partial [Chloroflexota bacterium]|nr:universal stress protein [Chloroflexota bacterium]
MYRTIVVPLDGSDLSERAIPFGRTLATAGRAGLVLMRVVTPTDFLDAREPAERDKALNDANAYVAGFVVPSEGDSKVEALAYAGDAARMIVDECRARPGSLIVMSTRGRSGVGELVYGGVTAEVIRRSERPVLVIPPR